MILACCLKAPKGNLPHCGVSKNIIIVDHAFGQETKTPNMAFCLEKAYHLKYSLALPWHRCQMFRAPVCPH